MLDRLKITTSEFLRFLRLVRSLYIHNDYHNYQHAVDVLQSTFFILTTGSFVEKSCDLEVFSLLLASYCHDIRHPGCSNQFLVSLVSNLSKNRAHHDPN